MVYEVHSRQNKNRHASQQIYNPKRDCPGNQLSLRLWLPQEPNMSMQKCYRLVTFFCNYNLITSCPQEMSWCDSGEINSKQSTFRKPTANCPPQDKMLSIHNCCRNANQTDNGKSNSTSHSGHPHKSTNNKCGKETGSSVQFSRSVRYDSSRSQHARPPCPSPSPGVHSDSRPSSP